MFPLHPSVQAGNRIRSTVALNFWLVLTPAVHGTILFVLARTRFTLARRENDVGSFAPSPFLSLRSQFAHTGCGNPFSNAFPWRGRLDGVS